MVARFEDFICMATRRTVEGGGVRSAIRRDRHHATSLRASVATTRLSRFRSIA